MADDPSGSTDLFEIMASTRAMRRLRPDPVPDVRLKSASDGGRACR